MGGSRTRDGEGICTFRAPRKGISSNAKSRVADLRKRDREAGPGKLPALGTLRGTTVDYTRVFEKLRCYKQHVLPSLFTLHTNKSIESHTEESNSHANTNSAGNKQTKG